MPSKHADRLGNQRVINDYDIYLRACSNLIYSDGEKMADSGASKAIASFGDNPICKNDVVALKAKLQPGIGRAVWLTSLECSSAIQPLVSKNTLLAIGHFRMSVEIVIDID